MIRVTIGNNLKRKAFNVDPNLTIRNVLEQTAEETGIDYTVGMMSLDGSPISGSDLDQTFAERGYTGEENHDKCFLLNVVKADNA
jgi:hypothetical protein